MNLYEELKWRNMVKDVSQEDLAQEMFKDGNFKFYTGFDPTADSLTVGHLVQIMRIKYLQDKGFKPYVLIGGATGLIGDPREVGERQLLDEATTLKNSEKIKKQLLRFLDPKKTVFVNNYDWIKKIDVISFLRDYGKLFNINYMLSKETIKKRIDTGLSFTEFTYTILQALDFYYLYKTYNVTVQFGGSEQWGNITSGLELIRKECGANTKVLGLSSHLLLKRDGTKFGKSEKGALFLDKDRTTPYEMYQYFLNSDDKDLLNYFKFLTLISKEEIEKILEEHDKEPHLRKAQEMLAGYIVEFVFGKKELENAKKVSKVFFEGKLENLKKEDLEILYKSSDGITFEKNTGILNLLTTLGLALSNREAREFVKNGAVTINGHVEKDEKKEIGEEDLLYNKFIIIRRGKKNYKIACIK